MKTLLAGLLLLLGAQRATAQKLPAADEAAIRHVVGQMTTNYADHHFLDMATYTTPDVSWVNIVGMWWRGRLFKGRTSKFLTPFSKGSASRPVASWCGPSRRRWPW